MMMAPDRFEDALYATPPLEVVEARILEMLAAGGNEFVPLSVLHEASGLPHGPVLQRLGAAVEKILRRLRLQPVPDEKRRTRSTISSMACGWRKATSSPTGCRSRCVKRSTNGSMTRPFPPPVKWCRTSEAGAAPKFTRVNLELPCTITSLHKGVS